MNDELHLPVFNDIEMDENLSPAPSDSWIEASREKVTWKRKRKKKHKAPELKRIASLKSKRIPSPTLKPTSSLKAMIKILSEPELAETQPKRSASTTPQIEKKTFSSPLFSETSSLSASRSTIFNRTASVSTSNTTFTSEYVEHLHNSQMHLPAHLDEDWPDLRYQILPMTSGKDSPLVNHPQSAVDEEWTHLGQQMLIPRTSANNSERTSHKDHRHSQSDVSLNEAFQSPIHENLELSSSDCDDRDDLSEPEEQHHFIGVLNQRLGMQDLNQSLLTSQNHKLSMQLRNFEDYVREKLDAAEEYMKHKLTQIEDANVEVMKALIDIKSAKNEKPRPRRRDEIAPTPTTGLVMPKIPVSRDFSLAILNSALKNVDYMKQFVSHVSHLVSVNTYNPRQSLRSLMTKLFTLNLLAKYCWTRRPISTKPSFTTLTNVLEAIARLLNDYMSWGEVQREIKEFFKEIPQIYEQQKKRRF